MLQEKVSAVTDGCMSRGQAGVEADLLSEQPRLGLSTAPTIPSASESDQVYMESPRQKHTDASQGCSLETVEIWRDYFLNS